MSEQPKSLSYLELRALLEIDWCDIAPQPPESMPWLEFWAQLEDFLSLEISDEVLEIYNSTLPKEYSFRTLRDTRDFIRRQLAIVERWVEDSKYVGD